MVDSPSHEEAVTKSKRSMFVALSLLVLVAAALAAGYLFLGGDELVADLLGGGATNESSVIPPKPSTEGADTTETPDASNETTDLPAADQAARMYWEQVASQEQIGKLVRGEISAVTIGSVTKSETSANVRITVAYNDGSSLSGTMVLRDYDGVWYFSSIARDGSSLSSKTSKPGDAGIVSTIVSQQAANQSIPLGIINGGYKSISIDDTSMGSGTATIGITLSGGTSAKTAGAITCVSKVINGEKLWFISSFAKK